MNCIILRQQAEEVLGLLKSKRLNEFAHPAGVRVAHWHCPFHGQTTLQPGQLNMAPTIYLYLLAGGVLIGLIATWPHELRLLRPAQMLLFPILLCCAVRAWLKFGPSFPDKVLSGMILLTTLIGFILTLAPNFIWLFRALTQGSTFQLEGRYIDEETHLRPIRELVEAEKYQEAAQRLEALLKSHRADFPALHLLVQLCHHLKKNKRAEECVLFMLRSASTDDERLAASRLYHQLTTA